MEFWNRVLVHYKNMHGVTERTNRHFRFIVGSVQFRVIPNSSLLIKYILNLSTIQLFLTSCTKKIQLNNYQFDGDEKHDRDVKFLYFSCLFIVCKN